MKKTMKSMLCLLLVLVMALQFGAVAPAARAEGVSDDATVALKLFVTGGDYYSEEAGGEVTDIDDIAALLSVSPYGTIGALRGDLTVSPAGDYAVTALVVTPAMGENMTDLLQYAAATPDEDDGAAIIIDGDEFTDSRLNGVADAYQLVIVLSPVTAVTGAAATCASNGTKPHFILNGEKFWDACCLDPVVNDSELSIPATGEHNIIEVPAVEATPDADGNIQYWKCSDPNCDKYFSDAAGENEITDKSSVITHYTAPAHTHTLVEVPAVEATPDADGNIQYWKCSDPDCDKYFSDAAGENEITDKSSVITHYTAPSTTYDIIASGTDKTWKKGSTTGAKIKIDADYSKVTVTSVKVGTVDLAASAYDVTSGSVVVTIHPDALEAQSAGKKTVTVTFSDGKTASTEITIENAAPIELTLSIDSKGCTKVYDGKNYDLVSLKNSIKVTGLPSGYKADVEISYEDSKMTGFHDAGTTKVKLHLKGVKDASDNDVTSQFTCKDKTGVTLTITKRKITVETRDDSKVYDGKPWTYAHMTNAQPIMTYTDPKLGEYKRDGKIYVQTISIKYTASPKSMGTYENKAELFIREKEKGSSATGADVTKNYEITYKFGKIKITDSNGNVPKNNNPATGDQNNIWLWAGLMAAAVVLVVVILVFTRKGKKNNDVPNS